MLKAPSWAVGGLVLTGLLGALAVWRLGPAEQDRLPVLGQAPAFRLTDQRGEPRSSQDLHGKVWLASFVYTSCPDVCPLITAWMARLRDRLSQEGLLGARVRLVSFTVDPVRDTVPVLAGYARVYGGSPPSEWAFLTGPVAVVRSLVQRGFLLMVMDQSARASGEDEAPAAGPAPPGGGYEVMHSARLVLVDGDGRIRAYYLWPEIDVDRVVADIHALLST